MSDSSGSVPESRGTRKPCYPSKKEKKAPKSASGSGTTLIKTRPRAFQRQTSAPAGVASVQKTVLLPVVAESILDTSIATSGSGVLPTPSSDARDSPSGLPASDNNSESYFSTAGTPVEVDESVISGSEVSDLPDLRQRRGSAGDLLQTSTPEPRIDSTEAKSKARSESALLRVRTLIKAAKTAELEGSVRQAGQHEDDRASESFMSDRSAVGGGALHELPRVANALLQKTKARLEESRNLNREIREDACNGIHGLYEMVLRLADSRNRHIAEKEKLRASYEHRIGTIEAKHASTLVELQSRHFRALEEVSANVAKTFKEAEASRYLAYDIEDKLSKNVGTPETTSRAIQNIQEDVAYLRLELGTLALTSLEGAQRREDQDPHRNDLIGVALESLNKDMANRFDDLKAECLKRPTYADVAGTEVSLHASPKTKAGTYSQPAKIASQEQPHFPLLIESTDPRHTCDDVVKTIKNKVDVIELGVGIDSIRKRRNQKVVVTCDSANNRLRMEKAIRSAAPNLTVTQVKAKKPLIRLVGLITDIADRQVEEAIMKQNVCTINAVNIEDRQARVVRRTKGRTQEVCNIVIEVTPSLYHHIKDRRLRIGYQVVMALDQSPILQCYRCLGYGHYSRECQKEVSCGHCAEGHDTRHCPSRDGSPKCVNCCRTGVDTPDHAAYSTSCPEWQKWDRIARSSIAYC